MCNLFFIGDSKLQYKISQDDFVIMLILADIGWSYRALSFEKVDFKITVKKSFYCTRSDIFCVQELKLNDLSYFRIFESLSPVAHFCKNTMLKDFTSYLIK